MSHTRPDLAEIVQEVTGVNRRAAESVAKAAMDGGWRPPPPTPVECETEGDGHEFEEMCTRCGMDPYEYFRSDR